MVNFEMSIIHKYKGKNELLFTTIFFFIRPLNGVIFFKISNVLRKCNIKFKKSIERENYFKLFYLTEK